MTETLRSMINLKRSLAVLSASAVLTAFAAQTTNAQSTPDLFFSEYLEGSSFNKAVELYNPTSSTIDFTGYAVAVYTNGSATPSITFNLTGTLAPGAVYVIANSQSDPLILAVADTTSGVCNFNGDDALVILKNGNPIDIIGQIGVDPGTNWTTSGGGATSEFTLIRNSSVNAPETNWTVAQNQWDVQPQNTFSFLGSHTGPVGISEAASDISVSIAPNPAAGAFSIRLPAKANNAMIEIFDLIGNKVLSIPSENKNQITVSSPLNPGVYVVKVMMDGMKPQTRRLVVQSGR